MYSWNFDKTETMAKTKNAIMGELECLLESQKVGENTANYWIDNTHNVFATLEGNGKELWIEVKLELYDFKEGWIGDLYCYDTQDLSVESLEAVVKEIVKDYYNE